MVGSLMHSCHLSILLGHSDEIPPGIGKTNKVIYSDGSETLNLDVELPNTTQEQVVKGICQYSLKVVVASFLRSSIQLFRLVQKSPTRPLQPGLNFRYRPVKLLMVTRSNALV